MQRMGGPTPADKDRAEGVQCELARARRIAEVLTSAGDRAIMEAYIRELSIRAMMHPERDMPGDRP